MNTKPLSRTWEWFGWLPLFLFTALIAGPPVSIWGSRFSQTTGPFPGIASLTWYYVFLGALSIPAPLITLAMLWAFEHLRGPLPLATKAYWLGMVAAAVIVGCVMACYFIWKWPAALTLALPDRWPAVTTLARPDFALTCWLFCGTLKPGFAVIAVVSGLLTAGIAIALKRGAKLGRWITTLLGLATLPIGLLLIVAGREQRAK